MEATGNKIIIIIIILETIILFYVKATTLYLAAS